MVAFSPGFGRIGSLVSILHKKDRLYSAWIAYFDPFPEPHIQAMLTKLDAKWIIVGEHCLIPNTELKTIGSGEPFNLQEVVKGIVVEKDKMLQNVVKVYQPNGGVVNLHIDEFCNPGIGKWVKFIPMYDFSNNLVAISPYEVSAHKGITIVNALPELLLSVTTFSINEAKQIEILGIGSNIDLGGYSVSKLSSYECSNIKIGIKYVSVNQCWELVNWMDEESFGGNSKFKSCSTSAKTFEKPLASGPITNSSQPVSPQSSKQIPRPSANKLESKVNISKSSSNEKENLPTTPSQHTTTHKDIDPHVPPTKRGSTRSSKSQEFEFSDAPCSSKHATLTPPANGFSKNWRQSPKPRSNFTPSPKSSPINKATTTVGLTGVVCAREPETGYYNIYTPVYPDMDCLLSITDAEVVLGDWVEFDIKCPGRVSNPLTVVKCQKIKAVFPTEIIKDRVVVITLNVYPAKTTSTSNLPSHTETKLLIHRTTDFIDKVWDVQRMITGEMAGKTVKAKVVYRPSENKCSSQVEALELEVVPWRVDKIISFS